MAYFLRKIVSDEDDILTIFRTKEEAEKFLKNHRCMKVGNFLGIDDTWIFTPRGYPVQIIYIENSNEIS